MIIALIGPDGCGKTTQARMLVERLNGDKCDTSYVHAYDVLPDIITPLKKMGLNRIGLRKFRESQLDSCRNSSTRNVLVRLLVGLLGCLYALTTYFCIRIFLGRKRMVICDRYFYQLFFDLFGIHCEKLIRVFPKPDKTFLFVGDLRVFYSRMIDYSDRNSAQVYYLSLIEMYNRLAKELKFIKIDANLSKENANHLIYKYLIKHQ